MNAMRLIDEPGLAHVPIQTPAQQLVARMVRRDQSAVRELFELLADKVHATAHRVLRNLEDTEEVVLDVFMQAFEQAPQYCESRGSVAAWILVMAHSRALDLCRRRGDQQRFSSLQQELHLADALVSDTPESASLIAEQQSGDLVRAALRDLPEAQRVLVEQAFLEGLSHQDLADRTGLPLGTVKSQIRRGMMRMRGFLERKDVHHGH